MDNQVTSFEQQICDREHLRVLAIGHYLVGATTALFSTIFLMHFFMGLAMLLHPPVTGSGHGDASMSVFGLVIMAFSGALVLGGWTLGGFQIYSGRMLQMRKKRMLSMVVAALSCANVPFGTALGVFTFIVLSRPTVKALYAGVPQKPDPTLLSDSSHEAEDSVWLDLERRSQEQKS